MAEATIQTAYFPRICVLNSPEVDEIVQKVGSDDSLVGYLRKAPAPEAVTVRNTRQMSARFNDFGPEFIPLPAMSGLPTLADADSALKSILKSPSDPFIPFLKSILRQTTGATATFETWSHPVCSILAVSCKHPNLVQAFEELFDSSYEHFSSLPFVNAEFLRYFVVVYDAEDDEQVVNRQLEEMKQHFGPHIASLQVGSQDHSHTTKFIHSLMSRSVVPFMEECCSFWYEQIVASKQSFAGRLLSVGRRYLSSSSKLTQNVLNVIAAKGQRNLTSPFALKPLRGTYNLDGSYYHWTAPQAQLRKIADFAIMLRDYKFANGIYEMLRKEFNNEKAWSYAAACQEMACVSTLLKTSTPLAKDALVDSLLDSTTYTYTSRCGLPLYAVRCIIQITQLLMVSPMPSLPANALTNYALNTSTAWLDRAIELDITTPLLQPVVCERLAHAYGKFNRVVQPTRRRKESFWLLVAAREWLAQGFPEQGRRCFEQTAYKNSLVQFPLHEALAGELRAES